MNGKKRKNKNPVSDSDKVSHFQEVTLASNHFNMKGFFTLRFNIHNFRSFFEKSKRNESRIRDTFLT